MHREIDHHLLLKIEMKNRGIDNYVEVVKKCEKTKLI